jgi:hypothetical protein
MGLFIMTGVVFVVALAVVHDRREEKRRRRRVAALLEDSRYGEALELLWSRKGGPVPLGDAVLYLEQCGVPRADAIENLCRILGIDPSVVSLDPVAGSPKRTAADPWARRPTPALSSAMLLPRP